MTVPRYVQGFTLFAFVRIAFHLVVFQAIDFGMLSSRSLRVSRQIGRLYLSHANIANFESRMFHPHERPCSSTEIFRITSTNQVLST